MTVPLVSSAHEPIAPDDSTAVPAISNTAIQAIAVIEQCAAALKAGDLKKAGDCLAADVPILESGGAEHSRQEYLTHHAAADAAFLKDAQTHIKRRTAHVEGSLARVSTESELRTSRNGAGSLFPAPKRRCLGRPQALGASSTSIGPRTQRKSASPGRRTIRQ